MKITVYGEESVKEAFKAAEEGAVIEIFGNQFKVVNVEQTLSFRGPIHGRWAEVELISGSRPRNNVLSRALDAPTKEPAELLGEIRDLLSVLVNYEDSRSLCSSSLFDKVSPV